MSMKKVLLSLTVIGFTLSSYSQQQEIIDDNCAGFNPAFNTETIAPAGGIQFKDDSDLITATSLTYSWDFGQGQSSTEQSPFMVFNEGDYQVILEVSDNTGCIATIEKTISFSYNNQ
jgi:PKD repeat protein